MCTWEDCCGGDDVTFEVGKGFRNEDGLQMAVVGVGGVH